MKQVLFLLHGMGESADGPLQQSDKSKWSTEVEAQLRAAASAYAGFPHDKLVIVPILYDDVFVTYAKTWAELAEQLSGSSLSPLVSWLEDAASSDFFWSNVGDVIQYRALEQVRKHVVTHVAAQMARVIDEHGTGLKAKYSILSHSLGTAVAHDAVQKLATTPIDSNTVLQPPGFRFETFVALANVSRLVWATDARFYDETRVRPLGAGLSDDRCAVRHYINVRHVADPFPSIVRFVRKSWPAASYLSLELRHVRKLNVHAFTHYLASPEVSDMLLYQLFGGTVIPRAQMMQRANRFQNYEGPRAKALAVAVSTVESTLNALSAQAEGVFEHDIDDIAKALWDLRNVIPRALKGGL